MTGSRYRINGQIHPDLRNPELDSSLSFCKVRRSKHKLYSDSSFSRSLHHQHHFSPCKMQTPERPRNLKAQLLAFSHVQRKPVSVREACSCILGASQQAESY